MNSTAESTAESTTLDSWEDWQSEYMQNLSDWTIVIGIDGTTEYTAKYHVHRVILSTGPRRSIYFSTLFKKGLIVTEKEENTSHLQLEDETEAKLFLRMLNFIYTGVLPKTAVTDAAVLFVLASRFNVPSLKEALEKFLLTKPAMTSEEAVAFFSETHQNSACEKLYDLLVKGLIYDITKLEDQHMESIKPIWLCDILFHYCQRYCQAFEWVTLELAPRCLVKHLSDLNFDTLTDILFNMTGRWSEEPKVPAFSPENAVRMLYVVQNYCPETSEDEDFDSDVLYEDFVDDIVNMDPTGHLPVTYSPGPPKHSLEGDEYESWETEVDLDDFADDESSNTDADLDGKFLFTWIRGECLKTVFHNRKELYSNEDMKDLMDEFNPDVNHDMLYNM